MLRNLGRNLGPVRAAPESEYGAPAPTQPPWMQPLLLALALAASAALVLGAARLGSHGASEAEGIVGILAGAALVYLVCTAEPVYIFTLAIVLTPFAGNWQQLHVPGPAAPDRLLFVIGTLSVLFRSYVLVSCRDLGSAPRTL